AGQLDDIEAGIGPVHEVNESAVVHLDVVRLDGDLAAGGAALRHAPLVRMRRHGRDVEADLLRIEGIADVHSPDAGIEVRDEDNLAVVDRRERLARRVRPEASTAPAEVSGRGGYLVGRDREWPGLGRDIDEEGELTRFLAFVPERFGDQDDHVALAAP